MTQSQRSRERIRGRYAPSPTGDLHLGNLRTAVLAYLFAHSGDGLNDGPGELLYRIEDLDRSRVRHGVADRQRADLEALGLVFDPPLVVQSERTDAYREALQSLAGKTFECFCSRREIAEAASAPHGSPGRYPGTCRDLTEAERAERRRTRQPAIRLLADREPLTVIDLVYGEVTGIPDDIVLQRNDGTPAYHLAVVLDDAESGVNQVVRGDDLLGSAISQAYLARLLGRQVPNYAHVPLALNAEGNRLAKRDGAVTPADLAARGVGPAEVLTMIAVSLDLAADAEPVDLETLRARFDPERLPRYPWIVTG
ncbi:tRNA glutamyl-Q(34) synthetase GluQRS [Microlunatus sp. Gsoil 973]|uniref:tRNA glutamyl-Q(34) synthetase GluQRS n=1 Tax=Microlunatus sp. Gsoil 973 TaxID=2672569 RepID=UPI001E3F8DE1|nr:tRNA glutamyl-Q(34) synthetase GluQRS [Microlunatus sp. Gsoil 973]